MKQKIQRIASFNCLGLLTSSYKKMMIADDFEKYHLNALAVQETHMTGNGTDILTSTTNKKYISYIILDHKINLNVALGLSYHLI